MKYLRNFVVAAGVGTCVACGLGLLANSYSAKDSVRDAVYAHSKEITPEVIRQANEAADKSGRGEMYLSIVNFATAGVLMMDIRTAIKKER